MDAPRFHHPIHGWVQLHYNDDIEDDSSIILEDYEEYDVEDPACLEILEEEINIEEAILDPIEHLDNTLFDRMPKEVYNMISSFLPISINLEDGILNRSLQTLQVLYGRNKSNLFQNIYPEFIKINQLAVQRLTPVLDQEDIFKLCSHLKYVDLRGLESFSIESMLHLLPTCKKAQYLFLANVGNLHLFKLYPLKQLLALTLETNELAHIYAAEPEGLAGLKQLPNLRSLTLKGYFGVTTGITKKLVDLTKLEQLTLNDVGISGSNLYDLAFLTNLKQLNILQKESLSIVALEDLKESLPQLNIQINGKLS